MVDSHDKKILRRISSTIQAEMDRKQLSQSDVARAVGCSQGYIHMLLFGKTNPTITRLIRIGNVLGISLEELTSGPAKARADG